MAPSTAGQLNVTLSFVADACGEDGAFGVVLTFLDALGLLLPPAFLALTLTSWSVFGESPPTLWELPDALYFFPSTSTSYPSAPSDASQLRSAESSSVDAFTPVGDFGAVCAVFSGPYALVPSAFFVRILYGYLVFGSSPVIFLLLPVSLLVFPLKLSS